MERLSPDDAAILALENANILGHTLKLVVVEPGAAGALDAVAVRDRVASRLERIPRLHQRVVLGPEPYWEDDDDFDLDRHVREPAGETPPDRAQLEELVGELMSKRLDHEHPLWTLDVVALADGALALVLRIHHCMADGMTVIRWAGELLWDDEPPPASAATEPASATAPARRRGVRAALRGGAGASAALARELGEEARRRPRSPLDRHISTTRAAAFAPRPLADLKRIGSAFAEHATVNDVVLAAVGGGLARWLAAGAGPVADMRVQVPVSLHRRHEGPDAAGNHDSFLFVDLPLTEPDPVTRLLAISAETRERKHHHDADVLYSFFHGLAHGRPLAAVAAHLGAGPRAFTLSVSNVPGPREPRALLGRPVSEIYTLAEPADRHALRVSVISVAGQLGFGLCADPDAVRDLDVLAAGIEAELDALLERAV